MMLDVLKLIAGLRRMGRDQRGNAVVIFGLCLVPMVLMTGLGIDYGMAITSKAKLDAAADAASLAAVSTAKAYIAANPTDPNAAANAIAAAKTRATNAFNVNAGRVPFTTYTLAPPSVEWKGRNFTATISYSASATNHFGQIIGHRTFNWNGTSQSVVGAPGYLDFYILVDVSGSMGLPSTEGGQGRDGLPKVNPDDKDQYPNGCMFACHYPSLTPTSAPFYGWYRAIDYKIQLRAGAVNDAVCKLLERASNPVVPDQYRVGLYPFINRLATLVPMTSDLKSGGSVWRAADCDAQYKMAFMNLLDTGTTQLGTAPDFTDGTGSGGTHMEAVFPQIKSMITQYGDGSSASSPQPFVFVITDGMQNFQVFATNPSAYVPQYRGVQGGASFNFSTPVPIDPAWCNPLKNAGAIVSILYIPYRVIPLSGTFSPDEIARANTYIPELPDALRQCASPGFFQSAITPTGITNALNAMFDKAVASQMAHLKQ